MSPSGQSRTPSGQKSSTRKRSNAGSQRRRQHQDETGIIPILARTVRTIESSAERGKVSPPNRVKFRVVAALVLRPTAVPAATTEGEPAPEVA